MYRISVVCISDYIIAKMDFRLFLLVFLHCSSALPENLFVGLDLLPAISNDLETQCLADLGFNVSTLRQGIRVCIDEGYESAGSSDDDKIRLSCVDKVVEKCWQKYVDPISRCLPPEAEIVVEQMHRTFFAGFYSWCEDNGRDFRAFWNRHEAACSELRSVYLEECTSILNKIEFQHFQNLFTKNRCKTFMQYRLCHAVDSTQCPVLREAYQSYLSYAYDASPCNQYSDI
uniref:Uncharacterized protein n=1 Tax=Strigamia maritima TaxID=126957 RepID=T1JBS7_STRMM